MLTDDERKTLTEAAKLLALDGMLDAAAGAPSLRDLATRLRAIAAPRVATVGELLATAPVGAITFGGVVLISPSGGTCAAGVEDDLIAALRQELNRG